jgi:hypothetical protein
MAALMEQQTALQQVAPCGCSAVWVHLNVPNDVEVNPGGTAGACCHLLWA